MDFNYTAQGRRPSVAQIISDWRKAGEPKEFSVTYGETYAHFEHAPMWGQDWQADGNGCRGVERDKVQAKLNSIAEARKAKPLDLDYLDERALERAERRNNEDQT